MHKVLNLFILKRNNHFLALSFLGLIVCAIYCQVIHGEFLLWDDVKNITENSVLINGNLYEFFVRPFLGMYIPISYSAWTGLYYLFGPTSECYHIWNITLHLINVFLLYLLAVKVIRNLKNFWLFFGLAIFALHPVQVETVAWISGGRELMASCLALFSIHANLSEKKTIRYVVAPILFVLGLMCKISIVPLPIVLWLLHILKNKKLALKQGVEYTIWLLLSLPFVFITFDVQEHFANTFQRVGFLARLFIALDTFGFYIKQFIFPLDLTADYARTPRWLMANWEHNFFPTIISLAIIGLLFNEKIRHKFLQPVLLYVIFLFPVSGVFYFVYQNISTVADRYMYLPIIGLAFALATYGSSLKLSRLKEILVKTFAVLFLIGLILLSAKQVRVWKNDFTFFENMLQKQPRSYSAHANLGSLYFKQNNLDKASFHIAEAFRLAPEMYTNFANYYVMLQILGQHEKVVELNSEVYTSRIEQGKFKQPEQWISLLNSLATSLYEMGDSQSALQRLCEVNETYPNNSHTVKNLNFLQETLKSKNLQYKCL